MQAFVGWIVRSIYRLYFHPLSKYPGPKLAAITGLWYCRHWVGGCWPHVVTELHHKYGDVIRVAPNELVFATAEASRDIYNRYQPGAEVQFQKDRQFYAPSGTERSLIMEPDADAHRHLRRAFDPGFNLAAVKQRSDIPLHHIDLLIQKLYRTGRRPEGENVAEFSFRLSFDIAVEMAFGKRIDTVSAGKYFLRRDCSKETTTKLCGQSTSTNGCDYSETM